VFGGIDTHQDTHTAALVDSAGRLLGSAVFPTTQAGYRQLLGWMGSAGTLARVGVEGTGSYGAGICRRLSAEGIEVVEVNRPDRSQRRRRGKSDALDAAAAAEAARTGNRIAVPKSRDGRVEALRVLRLTRGSAVKARTKAWQQLDQLLVSAPEQLRDQIRGLTKMALIRSCAAWRPDRLVTDLAPQLIAVTGIGTETAGQILVTLGDNPQRVRSEAAFAMLCGVAPLPASSGKTQRHRLNRGGDRQANRALHVIAITRKRCDPRTQAYLKKKTAERHTEREATRSLKRLIAREIYYLLNPAANLTPQPIPPSRPPSRSAGAVKVEPPTRGTTLTAPSTGTPSKMEELVP
jgi:transposase